MNHQIVFVVIPNDYNVCMTAQSNGDLYGSAACTLGSNGAFVLTNDDHGFVSVGASNLEGGLLGREVAAGPDGAAVPGAEGLDRVLQMIFRISTS